MKKLLSLVLAIIMICCLSVSVFAGDDTYDGSGSNDYSNEVVVKIDSSTAPDDVYYVVISWESLVFTYSYGEKPVWDPENHTYITSGEPGWDKTTAGIKVSNSSNVAITATATFTDADTEDNAVTATLTNASFSLEAPEVTAAGESKSAAPSDEITVTIGGAPELGSKEQFTVGTIKLTIGKKA